jgi:farnesyl diphosphate synthase
LRQYRNIFISKANRTDKDDWKAIEELVLEIGLLFQVQDDYLDCFGNPKVTGKVGSDIPENKCSWLIVKAYEKGDDRQRIVLKENYGKGQESTPLNEKKVKEIYDTLGLRAEYHKFEENCYKSICDKISNLSNKLPTTIFAETAEVIYHRNK